jgi:hypothetical protein
MTSSLRNTTRLLQIALLLVIPARLPLAHAQSTTGASHEVSEGDRLRGAYGPYRANNDLLYYHLDVRVDPAQKMLSGKNVIRFAMLKPGTRIQLDLVSTFNIDKIVLDQAGGTMRILKYERAAGRTVYVDFPEPLKKRQHVHHRVLLFRSSHLSGCKSWHRQKN